MGQVINFNGETEGTWISERFYGSNNNDTIVAFGLPVTNVDGKDGNDTIVAFGLVNLALGGNDDDTIFQLGTVNYIGDSDGSDIFIQIGGLNIANVSEHKDSKGDDVFVQVGLVNDITKKGSGDDIAVQLGLLNIAVKIGDGNDIVIQGGALNVWGKNGDSDKGDVAVQIGLDNVAVKVGDGDDVFVQLAVPLPGLPLVSGTNVAVKVGDGKSVFTQLGRMNFAVKAGDQSDVFVQIGQLNATVKAGEGNDTAVLLGQYNAFVKVGGTYENGRHSASGLQGDSITLIGQHNLAVKVGEGDDVITAAGQNNILVKVGKGNTVMTALGQRNVLVKAGHADKMDVLTAVGEYNFLVKTGGGESHLSALGRGNVLVKQGDNKTGFDTLIALGNKNVLAKIGDGDTIMIGLGNPGFDFGNDDGDGGGQAIVPVVAGDGGGGAIQMAQLVHQDSGDSIGLPIQNIPAIAAPPIPAAPDGAANAGGFLNILKNISGKVKGEFDKFDEFTRLDRVSAGISDSTKFNGNIFVNIGKGDLYSFALGASNIMVKASADPLTEGGSAVMAAVGQNNLLVRVGSSEGFGTSNAGIGGVMIGIGYNNALISVGTSNDILVAVGFGGDSSTGLYENKFTNNQNSWKDIIGFHITKSNLLTSVKKTSKGNNVLHGGDGDDIVLVYGTNNLAFGDNGNDILELSWNRIVGRNIYIPVGKAQLAGTRFDNIIGNWAWPFVLVPEFTLGDVTGVPADADDNGINSNPNTGESYDSYSDAFKHNAFGGLFAGGDNTVSAFKKMGGNVLFDFGPVFSGFGNSSVNSIAGLGLSFASGLGGDQTLRKPPVDTSQIADVFNGADLQGALENTDFNFDEIDGDVQAFINDYRQSGSFESNPDFTIVGRTPLLKEAAELAEFWSHDVTGDFSVQDFVSETTLDHWNPATSNFDFTFYNPSSGTDTDNDIMIGAGASNWMFGGGGNDIIAMLGLSGFGASVNELSDPNVELSNTAYGGTGTDIMIGAGVFNTVNWLHGGLGADIMVSLSGPHPANNGGKNASMAFPSQNNFKTDGAFLAGGAGDDVMVAFGPGTRVRGEAGNDFLVSLANKSIVVGGGGDDVIVSLSNKLSMIWAGGGNDLIISAAFNSAKTGKSYVNTGGGSDVVISLGNNIQPNLATGTGADIVQITGGFATTDANRDYHLGDDGDRVYAAAESIVVYGGQGNDWLFGGGNNSRFYGDAGNDILFAVGKDGTSNEYYGGNDNDLLIVGLGDDTLSGGQGDDVYLFGTWAGSKSTIIQSDAGIGDTDSLLFGTNIEYVEGVSSDVLFIKNGDNLDVSVEVSGDIALVTLEDWFLSSQENYRVEEFIFTNEDSQVNGDNLVLTADAIEDEFDAQGDNSVGSHEVVATAYNNDVTLLSDNPDTYTVVDTAGEKVYGLKENDIINGASGDDELEGHEGDDTLSGLGGRDVLKGDEGDDWLYGGAGRDVLSGGEDEDTLDGGDGDDILDGGMGADILLGGAGDDILEGGGGDGDVLTGGTGNDIYTFHAGDGDELIDNVGRGTDYDIIQFSSVELHELWFERAGRDLRIHLVETHRIDGADGHDAVTVKDWFDSAYGTATNAANILDIQLKDGSKLLGNDVQTLMDAQAVALGLQGSGLFVEEWDLTGVGSGSVLTRLTDSEEFQGPANETWLASNGFNVPTNAGDEYGLRVSGFLTPEISGNYTFWVSADNNAEVWLTTEQDDPDTHEIESIVEARKQLVASTSTYSSHLEFDQDPSQESISIYLDGGQSYFIEALMIENTGGDHLSVAWRNDDLDPGGEPTVISNAYLTQSVLHAETDLKNSIELALQDPNLRKTTADLWKGASVIEGNDDGVTSVKDDVITGVDAAIVLNDTQTDGVIDLGHQDLSGLGLYAEFDLELLGVAGTGNGDTIFSYYSETANRDIEIRDLDIVKIRIHDGPSSGVQFTDSASNTLNLADGQRHFLVLSWDNGDTATLTDTVNGVSTVYWATDASFAGGLAHDGYLMIGQSQDSVGVEADSANRALRANLYSAKLVTSADGTSGRTVLDLDAQHGAINRVDREPVHLYGDAYSVGVDVIYGDGDNPDNSGNDTLTGLSGDDTIYGEKGNDTIDGGLGDDLLLGGDGVDIITDTLDADGNAHFDDSDSIYGGKGNDIISGLGRGNYYGGEGHDQITVYGYAEAYGNEGSDTITVDHDTYADPGAADNGTVLYGGSGDDTITGGDGHDEIRGDADDDVLFRSEGNDTYFFATGGGHDTIEISQQNTGDVGTDVVEFTDLDAEDLWFGVSEEDANDLVVRIIGSDDSVTIKYWYSNSRDQVDFKTTNGQYLMRDDVQDVVDAFAGTKAPTVGGQHIGDEPHIRLPGNILAAINDAWRGSNQYVGTNGDDTRTYVNQGGFALNQTGGTDGAIDLGPQDLSGAGLSVDLSFSTTDGYTTLLTYADDQTTGYGSSEFGMVLGGISGKLVVYLGGSGISVGTSYADPDYVNFADGQVHNLNFSWDSETGDYTITDNDVVVKSGTGFKTGYSIDPDGYLVIGQEQVDKGVWNGSRYLPGEIYSASIWNDGAQDTGSLVLDISSSSVEEFESDVSFSTQGDVILGTNQIINGFAGNDTLHGGISDDIMLGDAGDDTLYGEDGADTIDGGAGSDTLYGGDGGDEIYATAQPNLDMGIDLSDNNGLIGIPQFDLSGDGLNIEVAFSTSTTNTNATILGYWESGSNGIVRLHDMSSFKVAIGDGEVDTGVALDDGEVHILGVSWDKVTGALSVTDNGLIIHESTLNPATPHVTGSGGQMRLGAWSSSGYGLGGILYSAKIYNTANATPDENGVIDGDLLLDLNLNEGSGEPVDGGAAGIVQLEYGAHWMAAGTNKLFGDGGFDNLHGSILADELHGGDGNDHLYGGESDDTLYGDDGDDKLEGDGGNDLMYGGDGKDEVEGGEGDDYLYGDDGDDKLRGGDGDDELWAGTGSDKLDGGDGDDKLYALSSGTDSDSLSGGEGADLLYGSSGDEYLSGGGGDDFVQAGFGADEIHGGAGNDELYGGAGNDTIDGDGGDDAVYGGDDNDILSGGGGTNEIYGGSGIDAYLVASGSGVDRIHDPEAGELVFFQDARADELWFERNGDDLLVRVAATESKVFLTDWFLSANNQLDFKDTNGAVLAASDVAGLVQSMGDTGVNWRKWDFITGNHVSDLTETGKFKLELPDYEGTFNTSFDFNDGAATLGGQGDDYGVQAFGWLTPPEDGEYVFTPTGNSRVEVYLSSGSDPANKQLIASYDNGGVATNYQDLNDGTIQASTPIKLQAGDSYYIEAVMKEGTGNDHLSLFWENTTNANSALYGSGPQLVNANYVLQDKPGMPERSSDEMPVDAILAISDAWHGYDAIVGTDSDDINGNIDGRDGAVSLNQNGGSNGVIDLQDVSFGGDGEGGDAFRIDTSVSLTGNYNSLLSYKSPDSGVWHDDLFIVSTIGQLQIYIDNQFAWTDGLTLNDGKIHDLTIVWDGSDTVQITDISEGITVNDTATNANWAGAKIAEAGKLILGQQQKDYGIYNAGQEFTGNIHGITMYSGHDITLYDQNNETIHSAGQTILDATGQSLFDGGTALVDIPDEHKWDTTGEGNPLYDDNSDFMFDDLGHILLDTGAPKNASILVDLDFTDGTVFGEANAEAENPYKLEGDAFGVGNDIIHGKDGNDFFYGKSGNDEMHGDAGGDTMFGGSGQDKLYGGAGWDNLTGGDGDDTIDGGSGEDWIWGDDGNDKIEAGDIGVLDTGIYVSSSQFGLSTGNLTTLNTGDLHVEFTLAIDPISWGGKSSSLLLELTGSDTIFQLFYNSNGDITLYANNNIAGYPIATNVTLDDGQAHTLNLSLSGVEDWPHFSIDGVQYSDIRTPLVSPLITGDQYYEGNIDGILLGASDSAINAGFSGTWYNVKISDDLADPGSGSVWEANFVGGEIREPKSDEHGQTNYGDGAVFTVGAAELIFAGADATNLYSVDNVIFGGEGSDQINGSDANDSIHGDNGDDVIDGGKGNDTIYSGTAAEDDDIIHGGEGDDIIYMESSGYNPHPDDDDIDADFDEDSRSKAFGGGGDDTIYSDNSYATLYGGAGDDTFIMSSYAKDADGNNIVDENGDKIGHIIYGEDGDDDIDGGGAADEIYGGTGNDYLHGDDGGDIYYFNAGDGHDTIHLFNSGDNDGTEKAVFLDANATDLWFEQSTNDLLVTVTGSEHQTVTVKDWFVNAVHRIDFETADGGFLNAAAAHTLVTALAGETHQPYLTQSALDDLAAAWSNFDSITVAPNYTLTSGNDTLIGDESDEIFPSYAGSGAGNDSFEGNEGDDDIYGGDGNDLIDGGQGADLLLGGAGDDVIYGSREVRYDGHFQGTGNTIGWMLTYGDMKQVGGTSKLSSDGLDDAGVFQAGIGGKSFDIGIAFTADSGQKGTLFSYTVQVRDQNSQVIDLRENELIARIDSNGHLNFQMLGLDIGFPSTYNFADGRLHDLNFVWDSDTGNVGIYDHGIKIYNTQALQGEQLSGDGGTLIFGQEQVEDAITDNHPSMQIPPYEWAFSGTFHSIYVETGGNTHIDVDFAEATDGNNGVVKNNGTGKDLYVYDSGGLTTVSNSGNSLYGNSGNDQLFGAVGDDLLVGGTGNDTLEGGGGNDQLYGEIGYDTLDGGDGNDVLDDMDNGIMHGGAGNDTLTATTHGYRLDLNTDSNDGYIRVPGVDLAGNQLFALVTYQRDSGDDWGSHPTLFSYGVTEDDQSFSRHEFRLQITDNNLQISIGKQELWTGLNLNDGQKHTLTLSWDGSDTVTLYDLVDETVTEHSFTEAAWDGLEIRSGGDLVIGVDHGTSGPSSIDSARAFTGSLYNLAIATEAFPEADDYRVIMDFETDTGPIIDLYSGVETEQYGDLNHSGGSELNGDDGDDVISVTGDGENTLTGGSGDDTLTGADGNDSLSGGVDNDTLVGGDGDDILDGGEGQDILDGGSGANTFKFGQATDLDNDVIDDAVPNYANDTVAFENIAAEDLLFFLDDTDGDSAVDDLRIMVNGETGNRNLSITNWDENQDGFGDHSIHIVDRNGLNLALASQVDQLIEAMSVFGGYTNDTDVTDNDLNTSTSVSGVSGTVGEFVDTIWSDVA